MRGVFGRGRLGGDDGAQQGVLAGGLVLRHQRSEQLRDVVRVLPDGVGGQRLVLLFAVPEHGEQQVGLGREVVQQTGQGEVCRLRH